MSYFQDKDSRGVQRTGLSKTPLSVTQKNTAPPTPSNRAHA
jgi:hypothetical protein